jgi:hypothetical protein
MELNFKGYCFIYKSIFHEFDKFIGNFDELMSAIKLIFKIDKNNSINISYIDCDGNFDIIDQNKYNEVLTYHMNKHDEFINIEIKNVIKLNPSKFINSAENLENFSLISENKENPKYDYNEIKKILKANNNELIKCIDKSIKESIMSLENGTKKLCNDRINKYHNLIIIKQDSFCILNDFKLENNLYCDIIPIDEFRSNHICNICNSWDLKPKYICTICNNFYICIFCEKEHSNHPLLTTIADSFFDKDKILINYFKDNRYNKILKQLVFNKDPINLHIIVINNIKEMLTNEKYLLEIKIFNLSKNIIKPKELILTTMNNSFFKIENKLIESYIPKYEGSIIESIEIISPNRAGQYSFEIGLIHSHAIIQYTTIKIIINVYETKYNNSSYNYISLDNFFLSYPKIISNLSFDHKLQIINMIKEKLTNLNLSDINKVLESNNYEFDKSLNQILNIN